ncbi:MULTISPECIES: hypothetical protein [Streptomyces]|uniref:Uncharacterized protein n=1 Tax=Streptomyces ehimensis TaxID=68195 RepID=A0ABV9BRR7_9ACTN|nr:hypothetical protein [Streptomyces luteoverticillatus]
MQGLGQLCVLAAGDGLEEFGGDRGLARPGSGCAEFGKGGAGAAGEVGLVEA